MNNEPPPTPEATPTNQPDEADDLTRERLLSTRITERAYRQAKVAAMDAGIPLKVYVSRILSGANPAPSEPANEAPAPKH